MKQLIVLFFVLSSLMSRSATGGCGVGIMSKNDGKTAYTSFLDYRDTVRITLSSTDSTILLGLYQAAGDCQFTNNHWFKNGVPISGDFECSAVGPGVYKVTTDVNPPAHYEIVIIVTATITSIDKFSKNSALNFDVFPNPSVEGLFTIERETLLEPCSLSIYNLAGQLIKEQKMNAKKAIVDISDCENGTYLLELTLVNGEKKMKKIIKEGRK